MNQSIKVPRRGSATSRNDPLNQSGPQKIDAFQIKPMAQTFGSTKLSTT